MRTTFFICTFISVLISYTCQGNGRQVYDELPAILSKHIEAYGGEENWEQVKALQLTGQHTSFSERGDYLAIKTRDGRFYSDYNLGKHRLTEGFDGDTFWFVNPWFGSEQARLMNDTVKNVVRQKAELFSPFYRWKEKTDQITFIGMEETDGLDMFVIRFSRPGMPPEDWYLDANTYLAYKYTSQWEDFTTAANSVTYFDDYRNIGGIVLPFYIEQVFSSRHTETILDEVIVNPTIDQNIFSMP